MEIKKYLKKLFIDDFRDYATILITILIIAILFQFEYTQRVTINILQHSRSIWLLVGLILLVSLIEKLIGRKQAKIDILNKTNKVKNQWED